ncbi:MAG: Hydroxypyruvate reductase [Paracidovorax wautersii]|uniref:Hydroxypyruvate reductase n=1 Tax=Paracidovorax wautersii TaxID=1177982 RepID=A0A7V8FNA2_9BURK|nr:MAG: Hydroxypyruvate reductase [Paracidovorax wautersii]
MSGAPVCVIAQPIHPVGAELLRQAGVEVRQAASPALDSLASALADADAVIVRDRLPASLMDRAPRLAVIANHGTGTDKIDVAHAHRLGIPVAYTPEANVRAVAEHALTLMLAAAHQAVAADTATRAGRWRFKYEQPMFSLYGKTLGIAGFGRTGRLVGEMAARGLGMQVLVWSPSADPAQIRGAGARPVGTLAELLAAADVLSLHRPYRCDTHHMLDAAALRCMKPGAIVVNTSRGGLIDEAALVQALRSGALFGAGLDVFEHEPLPAGSALAGLPNVVLTPHVAGSSQEALHATATQCARQVMAALRGQRPDHLVDPSRWDARRAPHRPLAIEPESLP